jgi:[ribosomal protein S5]-alanine N-acetyltransferase
MEIKFAAVEDASYLSKYYLENAGHLQPWERKVELGFHEVDEWKERLRLREIEQREGRSTYFLAYCHDPREIVASCSLTGITRGAFMACYMGYSVAKSSEGKGIMRKLCDHATNYAFNELGLHRVMANYMPVNRRSELMLERMGFVKEGLAKKYLFINGKWEDHILTALINPNNT